MQTCVVVAINVCLAPHCQPSISAHCSQQHSALFLCYQQPTNHLHSARQTIGIQSLGCLVLTAQAASVTAALTASGSDDSTATTSAAATAVCSVVIFVNTMFVASFGWQVVRLVDWRVVSSKASKLTRAAAVRCGVCNRAQSGGCLTAKGPSA